MNIKEMTHADIEARKAQIAIEMDNEGADIDALTEEVRAMNARDEELGSAAHKAEELRKAVSGGAGTVTRSFAHKAEERSFGVDSKEYRNAWMKNMQGKELNDAEKRAFVVSGSPVPTMTVNRIMDVVRQHAWLLERSSVIYANSKITYYIEQTTNAAEAHVENASISPKADTLIKIDLTPAEICKMIQVSDSASQMSIDVFEMWLVDHLGKAIARFINNKIITTATGVAADVGSNVISAATVQELLGTVKGDDIALVCNNKTLFTKLLPLQDDGKNALVRFDGGRATVYGRVVLLDDEMADDNILCGDWSKMVCAIAEDINVKKDYDIDTNSYKYLGVAMFDCKVGINAAFAKITSA